MVSKLLIIKLYQRDLLLALVPLGLIGKSMALGIPNGQGEYEDYLRQGLGTGKYYISPTDPAEVLTIINSLKPKRS